MANKEKLIEVLRMIDPQAAGKAEAVRTKKIIDLFEQNDAEWSKKLETAITALADSFSATISKHNTTLSKQLGELAGVLREHGEAMDKRFVGLSKDITGIKPTDYSTLFKDFPTLMGENAAHTKRMADLVSNLKWNASMQIRNQDGSPMTPFAVGQQVGTGNGSVTTAGTAINLPTGPCTRVVIYSNSANSSLSNYGIIVVGDSSVVASESTRRGAAIYPANGMEFYVNDLSRLWIDATDNGAKYHYLYEKPF